MTTARNLRILIVDPDAHFREELYNFLLSAGYEIVDSAGNYEKALERIEEKVYDVTVLDAGCPLKTAIEVAHSIVSLRPETRVILMVDAEVAAGQNQKAATTGEHQFLIKATFARNLLYLLEKGT
jgi:DNA-binding NtrC family response regulator